MASITNLLKRKRQPSPQPFNPTDYWESRHQKLAGSLRAVGSIELTDDENADQYTTKANHLLDLLANLAPDPSTRTLLDAGCGTGQLTRHFAAAGYQTTGVDFSETAITQARRNVPTATFHVSPLPTLDLPGKPYDIITICDVLMHLVTDDDWQNALTALATHLAEGGHLIIMDYFPESPEQTPAHFAPRPLDQYESTLKSLNLTIQAQTQLHLPTENVVKDIVIIRL